MLKKNFLFSLLLMSSSIYSQVDTLHFNHLMSGNPNTPLEEREITKIDVDVIIDRDKGEIKTGINGKYNVLIKDLYTNENIVITPKEEKDITFTAIDLNLSGTFRSNNVIYTFLDKESQISLFNSDKDLSRNAVTKKKDELWEHSYYVDDFGDQTKEGYSIMYVDNGVFSNSATTNSDAYMQILKEDNGTYKLYVYEYRADSPANFSSRRITIRIKDSDNKEYKIKGKKFGKNIIGIDKKYTKLLEEVLSTNGTIKLYFSEGEYTTSTYRFKFDIY